MIIYYKGTVFNSGAEALVNTVNCVGFMGGGIALEYKLRYPEMFEDYAEKCKRKQIQTGKVDYYKYPDGVTIVNFPTKYHFKYPSQLSWIRQGLADFLLTYKQQGFSSVAFPKLGCGKGNLDWNEVKPVMEKMLGQVDIDVYICLDEVPAAQGVEKQMLDAFEAMTVDDISQVIKLNAKQKSALENSRPYRRFYEIALTGSIGKTTYERLFTYFYKIKQIESKDEEQIKWDV